MNTIKRTIEIAFLVAAFLALALSLFFRQHLDEWLAACIADTGEKLLHTQVSASQVALHFSEGRAEITHLKIHNLAGFTTPWVLEAPSIVLTMNLNNLQPPKLSISTLTIEGLQIRVEQHGLTSNIANLLETLTHFQPTLLSTDAKQQTGNKLFIIEQLNIAPSLVQLITEHYGTFEINLPASTQQNLGAATGGLSAEALAKMILEGLFQQAKTAAKTKFIDLAQAKAPNNGLPMSGFDASHSPPLPAHTPENSAPLGVSP